MVTLTTLNSGWRVGLRAILLAVAGNLVLRLAALTVFDIPAEFAPLALSAPTVLFTVVGVAGGLGVSVLVTRFSEWPARLFRQVVFAALVVSVLPDFWLLTDGAAAAFPGATIPAVATLIAQHVLAALVVLRVLTT